MVRVEKFLEIYLWLFFYIFISGFARDSSDQNDSSCTNSNSTSDDHDCFRKVSFLIQKNIFWPKVYLLLFCFVLWFCSYIFHNSISGNIWEPIVYQQDTILYVLVNLTRIWSSQCLDKVSKVLFPKDVCHIRSFI